MVDTDLKFLIMSAGSSIPLVDRHAIVNDKDIITV